MLSLRVRFAGPRLPPELSGGPEENFLLLRAATGRPFHWPAPDLRRQERNRRRPRPGAGRARPGHPREGRGRFVSTSNEGDRRAGRRDQGRVGSADLHVRCLMGPTSCRDADVDAETHARRQAPSIHRASARNHPSPRRENESSCSGGLCSNGANCAIPCSYLCRLTIAELGCIGLDSVLGSGFTGSQASCGARRQGTVP